MVDASGCELLPAKRIMYPMAPGLTTVRFTATATAAVGMPHTPATAMVRVPPEGSAGPPLGPLGLRVSMSRHGVTGKNFDAALGVFVVTVTVAVALFAEPQLLLTRTQYDVVVDGETSMPAFVAP